MSLNAKKRKVIEGYLRGLSKKDAMLDAGYSESTAATKHSDIFGDPEVQAEIDRRQNIAAARTDITLEWVNNKLKEVAEANLGDMITIHEDGTVDFDYNKMTPAIKQALSNFTTETYMEGRGPNAREVKRIKVGTLDKLRALELLVRFNGLSKEKVVVDLEGDLVERLQRGRQIASASGS